MKHSFVSYFLLFFILTLTLDARDNPFDAVVQDSVTNAGFSSIYLKEEKVFLPDNARELDSIIFQYKTLSGKKEIKRVEINNAIDWHNPIIIKQETSQFAKRNAETKFVEYVPFNFIKYKMQGKEIFIYTSQNKIRHFHLPRPFKLVFDFDANYRFKTLTKDINRGVVKSITTGAHQGFVRTTILLDAPYKYRVDKVQSGYKITLE